MAPALSSDNSAVANISVPKVIGIQQSFIVDGKGVGTATLDGKWTLTGTKTTNKFYPLKVSVGNFADHTGMTVDLLAKVLGRSNDTFKIFSLLRMLNNNTGGNSAADLFDQVSIANLTRFGTKANPTMICGSVGENIGNVLMGKVSTKFYAYHKLLTPGSVITKRDDVKYDSARMVTARAAIKKLLDADTPVVVGCAHDGVQKMTIMNGALQRETAGGHTVLIVGCNDAGSKFLYADPWYGGSHLAYTGGVARSPSRPKDKCEFLGEFETDATRGDVLRQTKVSEGTFASPDNFLEVISGPL